MEEKVEHFEMEFEKNLLYMPDYIDDTRQDNTNTKVKTKKRQRQRQRKDKRPRR